MSAGAAWMIVGSAGVIALLFGAFMFFMVIIALNGFSERQAAPMLLATGVLIVLNIVLTAGLSQWVARMVQGRTEWSMWVVGPLAVLAALVAGGVLLIGGVFIGLVILSSRYG